MNAEIVVARLPVPILNDKAGPAFEAKRERSRAL